MNGQSQGSLEDLLDRELDTARRLSMTLASERAALTGAEPQTVQQLATEKLRLFAELESLEAERRSRWGSRGSADAGLIGTVAQRWRALMELIAGCRTANEVNGQIIHIRQNQIRQLIDIVRGGAPLTYGPQGKTFAKALRALARA